MGRKHRNNRQRKMRLFRELERLADQTPEYFGWNHERLKEELGNGSREATTEVKHEAIVKKVSSSPTKGARKLA